MIDVELELNHSCEEAVRLVTRSLERHGLMVTRDFDLRSALNTEGLPYACPNHGTDDCTCNYVVLSVYQMTKARQPLQLANQIVIHDRQGNAWLSLPALVDAQGRSEEAAADPRLLRALAEALNEMALRGK